MRLQSVAITPGPSPPPGVDKGPARASREALDTAIWFFLLAAVVVAAGTAVLAWFHRPPSYLTICAGTFGLDGLIVSLIAIRAIGSRSDDEPLLSGSAAEVWCTFAVFIAFLALYGATSYPETALNEQTRQAVAFLHGHTYIDAPSFIEHATVGKYAYALHPPLAPILLMPLAAIWGMQTPQTSFCVFVGALSVAFAWRLLGKLKLSTSSKLWLTFFFAIGTDYWMDVIAGNTWALPMVVSVFFTVAALDEVFGEARPTWLGVYTALACLSRYDLVLATPVYAALAYKRGRSIRELLWMAPAFIVVGVVFVGLNEARFHTFFDVGVVIEGPKGMPAFALRYLPQNIYTLFFMAPVANAIFPYIHPTFVGQGIPLTSPAFALAFRARCRRFETPMMWFAALAGSIASLLCYANGFAQFGTRHYIQVFPFLLVLMAIGMRRRPDQLAKALIVISIFLITFGIWHIRMYGYG